jgi:hypothetical protein
MPQQDHPLRIDCRVPRKPVARRDNIADGTLKALRGGVTTRLPNAAVITTENGKSPIGEILGDDSKGRVTTNRLIAIVGSGTRNQEQTGVRRGSRRSEEGPRKRRTLHGNEYIVVITFSICLNPGPL